MYCPHDASELQKVVLDERLSTAAAAHQCVSCGGALLDVDAQRAVLGTGLSASDAGTPTRLACPKCLDVMAQLPAGPVHVARCGACDHIWFEHGQLVVVRALVRQLQSQGKPEEATKPSPCPSPLDGLALHCADCDKPITNHTEVVDLPSGIVCKACHGQPGFSAQRPGPGSHTYDHAGAAVTATHQVGAEYRGTVRVQTTFEGTLDARVKPLSVWGRMRRFWVQDLELSDERLASRFEVVARTPVRLQEFLRERGVAQLLLELERHGEAEFRWSAKRLDVSLRATRDADRAAIALENTARRLYDAYRRFCENT